MKRLLGIYLMLTQALFAQSIVIKTDESYFIYNQHHQLEIEASIKYRTVKLIDNGLVTIYPNQLLNDHPFIPLQKDNALTTGSGIKISSYSRVTSRYVDIANNLYSIEKKNYIMIEEAKGKLTVEGENFHYSRPSNKIFYFRGDHPYYYDFASKVERQVDIQSKIVTSVTGDSSYRWIFEDSGGELWIYNRFEAASKVAIYTLAGRLQHSFFLPSDIIAIYLSYDIESYKERLTL